MNRLLNMIAKTAFINHYAGLKNSPALVITAILDIFIIFLVLYYLYKKFKNTKVEQLLKGIALLFVFTIISEWLNLYMVHFVLYSMVKYGALGIVIIFQPEIRKTLEKIGKTKIGKQFGLTKTKTKNEENIKNIESIVNAAENLSGSKTGALIVFEKEDSLEEITKTAIKIDADISRELIENIFIVNTPLHDGAVVIRDFRIDSGCCILPLAEDSKLSKSYGTRHRAGLGVSTVYDAIAIIVSEETGKISLCINGKMIAGISPEKLKNMLIENLFL